MPLIPPPQSKPGERPSFVNFFTPELGELIRARLEGGETVRRLCAQPGMPISTTFYRWRAIHREWGASIVSAQQAGSRLRTKLRMEAKAAKAKPSSPNRWARPGSLADSDRRRSVVLEVARGLALGEPLTEICAKPDMPVFSTVHRWLHEDPELALIYGEARAAQEASYEAQVHDLFANLTKANRAESRRRFQKLRTQMSRRAAKGWGLGQRPPPLPKTWEAALLAWERADPPAPTDTPEAIKAARKRLGLSQAQFAARFGLSAETLRNYEQGHRRPTGPTRVLLAVIAAEPAAVMRVVGRSLPIDPLSGTLSQSGVST